MRTLVTCSVICALALMVGCGSDSDATTGTATGGAAGSTGGTANAGGDSATGGASATGGSSSTDACNVPACLGDAMIGCVPSGPCTQASSATLATDKCFESGVKTETQLAIATMSFSMVAKNATSTCYSLGGPFSAFSVKDGSGTEIGTGSVDMTTLVITLTCNGGQPVVLNAACNYIADALNPMSSTCTAGTCAF